MRPAVLASCLGLLLGCELNAGALGGGGPEQNTAIGTTGGTTDAGTTTGLVDSGTTIAQDTGATVGPPMGTTTAGSTSADGGSSDSTGIPSPLVGNGLLARWFVDEASGGQAPIALVDATEMPVDLPLMFVGDVMNYDELDGNRGLRWTTNGDDSRPVTPIGGTKLEDGLAQAQRATLELILAVGDIDGDTSRFLHIGPMSTSQLVIGARRLDRLQFRWNGIVARNFVIELTEERQVVHVVIDTTQAVPEERVRAYRNGTPLKIASIDMGVPAQGEGIPLTSDASLSLGNRSDGQRSFTGHLGYAAIYTEPLTPFEVSQNADVLGKSDDTQ